MVYFYLFIFYYLLTSVLSLRWNSWASTFPLIRPWVEPSGLCWLLGATVLRYSWHGDRQASLVLSNFLHLPCVTCIFCSSSSCQETFEQQFKHSCGLWAPPGSFSYLLPATASHLFMLDCNQLQMQQYSFPLTWYSTNSHSPVWQSSQ